MSIEIDATYRSGAIYPEQPLALPENTPVRVVVVEKAASAAPSEKPRGVSLKGLTREQIIALRPKAPKFTGDELRELIAKHSVSVGSLPADFSREDIYSDHD
jgi:hypothetical protein